LLSFVHSQRLLQLLEQPLVKSWAATLCDDSPSPRGTRGPTTQMKPSRSANGSAPPLTFSVTVERSGQTAAPLRPV